MALRNSENVSEAVWDWPPVGHGPEKPRKGLSRTRRLSGTAPATMPSERGWAATAVKGAPRGRVYLALFPVEEGAEREALVAARARSRAEFRRWPETIFGPDTDLVIIRKGFDVTDPVVAPLVSAQLLEAMARLQTADEGTRAHMQFERRLVG